MKKYLGPLFALYVLAVVVKIPEKLAFPPEYLNYAFYACLAIVLFAFRRELPTYVVKNKMRLFLAVLALVLYFYFAV